MSGKETETGRWHQPSLQGRGPGSRKPRVHSVPQLVVPGALRGALGGLGSPTPRQTRRSLRLESQGCLAWGQAQPVPDQKFSQNMARGRARSVLGTKTSGKEPSPAASWQSLQLSEPPLPRLQNGVALLLKRHWTGRGSAPAVLTPSSGFLPGVCGVAVGYPLDTVKVCGDRPCSPPPPPPPPRLPLHPICGQKSFLGCSSHPALPTRLWFLLLHGAHCPCSATESVAVTSKELALPLPQGLLSLP